jgi:hypothetical protein
MSHKLRTPAHLPGHLKIFHVARQLEIEPEEVLAPGNYAPIVKARSLSCYWGARQLRVTTVDLARRLNLAQPTDSQAVKRGQKIAEEQGLSLLEK